MTENKTKETNLSVEEFLGGLEDPQKKADAFYILKLMQNITKHLPKLWGTSIVGFGSYHYKYESGREGDAPIIGFSPRKQNFVLYLKTCEEIDSTFTELLKKLGKYKTGKSCLYIKKMSDVDSSILEQLIQKSWLNKSS